MKAKLPAVGIAITNVLTLLTLLLPSTTAMGDFTPLPCNAALTIDDCDGTTTLSSILLSSSPTIPCGTCAIADIINGETLSAPNGLDIEGMLYFPPSASGILEAAHIIVQGVLKIDPPTPIDDAQGRTNGQVKILLNGPDSDVYMTPHTHNAMACEMGGGSCNVGKRPIVVAGGRLDIRGMRDIATDGGGSESCPAWVPLRSVVPPPLVNFERIQAENYNSHTGELRGTAVVGGFDIGDSVTYDTVDFGSSDTQATSIKIRYSKDTRTGSIEIKSDNQVLATFSPERTHAWSNYKEVTVTLDVLLTGEHPLTLLAKTGIGVANLDWFELSSKPLSSVLSIGPRAASCWDSTNGGDLLLTNAAYRGGWDDQKVLSLISSTDDGSSGLVTVDMHEDLLGNPPTEENEPTMPAEIASLSRPVVFESVRDGPSDHHGGHLIIFHTPNVAQRLEGVEIRQFGQQGTLGRYPIHFHKCGHVGGSVVKNNVIRNSLQRCIVVHRSNAVLVENNVAYDTFGHCFITEDGVETDNIFKDNLGAKTKKQRSSIGASDSSAATFWVTNTRNYFVGNVAAGSSSFGFWFEGPGSNPLYQFERNVAHNNDKFGIALYPKGYMPEKMAYFDDCKMYNNRDGGMRVKRSRNIRIRNNFFADNKYSIEYLSNPNYNSVADSTFYAVAPRKAATRCVNGAMGIEFNLDRSYRQVRVTNSSFHGFGNVPEGCTGPGVALQLSDIQGKADDEYGMPLLEEVTFDSPGNSFGITSNEFVDRTIFLEDEDGGMNPTTGGGPGFYVHDEVHNMAFLKGMCSPTSGVGSKELQYCQGVCMRRVYIDTSCCSSTSTSADLAIDAKLVLTSRTDPTKTYTYDKRTIVTKDKRGFVKQDNQRFDIALPADEYDFTLVDPQTDERVYPFTIIDFERTPSCVGYVTEDSFHTAPIPDGYFDLYKRIEVEDRVDSSGLSDSGGSFDPNDWMTFSNVWFGKPGESARMRINFGKGKWDDSKMEVRLGDKNGRVIGTFYPWNTGGYGTPAEATFAIDDTVHGLQRVTLVGKDSSGVLNLHWFELAPPVDSVSYSLHARVQAENVLASHGVQTSSVVSHFDRKDFMLYDDVWFGSAGETTKIRLRFAKKGRRRTKMEVRLDGLHGKIIGSFTPWMTAKRSWSTYVEGTFDIDGTIEGLHKLVFYGKKSRGIMNIDWFELAGSPRPAIFVPQL